ncbi:caspase family protein [Methylobacterium goesingense]|uniref:Caspase-like protein n=1 Tax=Methylobacterium goesingense TaxID=243690 RepID=A0ABV2L9G3_9HYPH|nr:caspase family protein [Methylobacterium goesingense]GJD76729.1 hypothetical protein CFIICLFH_4988 [Methylobacterium goesingense]
MNDRRSAWHRPTVSTSASVPARVASWLGFAGLVALGLGFSAGTASAENRVALVIGNTGYHNLKALTNPANDAKDVAAALKARGFTVLEGRDLERNAMRGVVERFQAQARTADVSVVYYAGHGFQLDGQNYLVPVDATIKSRGDVETGTLNLRSITEGLEGSRGIHLVFLDACRNNPLRGAASTTDAGLQNGLARMGNAAGFLFAYATQPDNVAFDGGGRNSPFAQAFLSHIATRGQDIASMMIAVRKDVIAATGGFQVPWENSSLTSQFYFTPGQASVASPETQLWQIAAASRDTALLRIYLSRYPDGPHANEVKSMITVASADPVATVGTLRSTPDADRVSDDRLWDLAQRSRLRQLVEFYVTRHPDGRHVNEAQELLQSIPTAEDADARPESLCERSATHPRDATANTAGVTLAELARNPDAAIAACRAARQNHPEMPHYTALLARALAAAGQRAESVALYQEAAGRGNLRAMVSLGLQFETGDGLPRDPREAANWYEKAADGGSPDGAINLAVSLMEGVGRRKDPARALALLKAASEAGSAIATYNLGVLAQQGVLKENGAALNYFRKATELGDPRGFVSAAILLDEGRGVRKDPDNASDMLLMGVASDSGDAASQIIHRSSAWSTDTIRRLQERLRQAGYYRGPIDGKGGAKMETALRKWRSVGILDMK